ncbi:DUF4231 domain-containing protein [Vannielia sp. SX4]|uniref:DUF4231 domain-containing protein n=1 Tax=Vannielia sp. SX4 TaxID=3463852 RepID=UPI00405A229D
MTQKSDSGYARLEDQIDWYDSKSMACQRYFKRSKVCAIVFAALIPILSVSDFPNSQYVVAILGAIIAVLEGLSHLNQWQHNWITYRSTCEALRHEKFTYIERADPYDIEDDREARKLLVERVESLISTEHSKWIAVQDEAAEASKNKPRGARSPN